MFRRVSTDWKSLEFPTGPVYPTEVSTSIYWNQLLFLFGMCLTWNRLQNVCNFLFLFAQTSLTSCSSESFLCSRRNCRTERRCSRSSRRTATCCLMSSAVRMRTRTSWSWTTASWPPAGQEELFIKTEQAPPLLQCDWLCQENGLTSCLRWTEMGSRLSPDRKWLLFWRSWWPNVSVSNVW